MNRKQVGLLAVTARRLGQQTSVRLLSMAGAALLTIPSSGTDREFVSGQWSFLINVLPLVARLAGGRKAAKKMSLSGSVSRETGTGGVGVARCLVTPFLPRRFDARHSKGSSRIVSFQARGP